MVAEGSRIADNARGDSGGALMINGSASSTGTATEPIIVTRNFSADSFGGLAAVTVGATPVKSVSVMVITPGKNSVVAEPPSTVAS